MAGALAEVEFIGSLESQFEDNLELWELAQSENDQAAMLDVMKEIDLVDLRMSDKEEEMQFDGPHDKSAAIITIMAGAGGTDAQDWAQMLERMYLRFAERRGWKASALYRSVGEEAGIKRTTFEINGPFAFGILRSEHGVHRLVSLSPFNADSLRQTSFAKVEVLPKLSDQEAPDIDIKDLKIDTYRASGAGGQHVNKTSSAVRITHQPTGIVVQSQSQRSQAQNKAQAMAHLLSKLHVMAQEQQAENIKELKGEAKQAAWGNQIRSYVLHPYTMVKDHRTKVETANVQEVLDGDLSKFVLKNRK